MTSRHQTVPSSSRMEHAFQPGIDLAIAKLRNNINATRKLEAEKIEFDDPRVDITQKAIRETIRDVFGDGSPEYYDHSQHKIWHGSQIYLEARNQRQQKFTAGIPHTVSMLEGLISRLKDRDKILKADVPVVEKEQKATKLKSDKPGTPEIEQTEQPRHIMTRRVCVVHDYSNGLSNTICDYMKQLGLEPVVLHQQPHSDRSIVEKIDTLPEVDFALVLLNSDDFFQTEKTAKNGKSHMKRNVLFELGYFIGRLGQSRVCALYDGKNKLPGDYDGITCININEIPLWRRLLGLELRNAGFDISVENKT